MRSYYVCMLEMNGGGGLWNVVARSEAAGSGASKYVCDWVR